MLRGWLVLSTISMCILIGNALASSTTMYVINFANETRVYVNEFSLNEKFDSVTFKSMKTGITSTVPLNRIKSVEMATQNLDNAENGDKLTLETVYTNDTSLADRIDDGGIPCNFYIVSSSGGGSTGKGSRSSSGMTSAGNKGNSFSNGFGSSNSSGSSFSNSGSGSGYSSNNPFNSSSSSSSRGSSSGSGWSNNNSSGSGSDAFFNMFFNNK